MGKPGPKFGGAVERYTCQVRPDRPAAHTLPRHIGSSGNAALGARTITVSAGLVELGHQLNLQPSAAATVHYSRYVTTGEMDTKNSMMSSDWTYGNVNDCIIGLFS